MSAPGKFLRQTEQGYLIWCPACEEAHHINVGAASGPNWSFNGNLEAPTFSPSLLVRSGHYAPHASEGDCWCKPRDDDEDWGFKCAHCHSFIRDGQWQFLGDCSHEMAGQTVSIVEFPR